VPRPASARRMRGAAFPALPGAHPSRNGARGGALDRCEPRRRDRPAGVPPSRYPSGGVILSRCRTLKVPRARRLLAAPRGGAPSGVPIPSIRSYDGVMNRSIRLSTVAAGLLGAACASGNDSAPAPSVLAPTVTQHSGTFQVVGRGPVTRVRTTDVVVFTGRDGRDYAYTGSFGACANCARGNVVFVWDVTDPRRPVKTDSVVVDAIVVNDVQVNADASLGILTREGAESRRNGIVLLDLADPAHPKIAGEHWETLTGGSHNAFLDGQYAYVTDEGAADLRVLDISNPADPVPVGRWSPPAHPGEQIADVVVRDGLAFVAAWDDGLAILDVGNGIKEGTPQRPRLVSQFRYRTEFRGERYGHTHYALPYTNRAGRRYVFVGDEIVPAQPDFQKPVPTGGYLHVIDITNVEMPVEVATYDVPGHGVHNFSIRNDTMWMAAYGGGVRAVDVSGDLRGSLRNREIAAALTTDSMAAVQNATTAWAAVPHKGHVYVSDFNSGLWIFRLVPGAPAPTPAAPAPATTSTPRE
jgi:hypothetical protein